MGTVTPAIAEGALGPSSKLSKSDEWTNGNLSVFFNDYTSGAVEIPAKIQYAGLAPGLAGLYQVNVKVPAGFAAGDVVYIEFQTEGADMNEIQVPVGGAAH